MAEIADEPDEYLSDEERGQLSRIQTCVYLVLSASRSISRILLKSPDFFTSVSRFSVF